MLYSLLLATAILPVCPEQCTINGCTHDYVDSSPGPHSPHLFAKKSLALLVYSLSN